MAVDFAVEVRSVGISVGCTGSENVVAGIGNQAPEVRVKRAACLPLGGRDWPDARDHVEHFAGDLLGAFVVGGGFGRGVVGGFGVDVMDGEAGNGAGDEWAGGVRLVTAHEDGKIFLRVISVIA